MAQLGRRDVLRAGLALPGLIGLGKSAAATGETANQPKRFEEMQKSTAIDWPGYSGTISEASAEKGKQIVQISEDGIVRLVENWLQHDQAPGSW